VTELVLVCPGCATAALADDEFCERCGTALGDRRDAGRDHVEVDAGTAGGVSDRGRVHRRNEDALYVAATGTTAVAVVCDGVSSSAAPQVASTIAAESIGECLATHPGAGIDAMASALGVAQAAVVDVPWLPSTGREAPASTAVAARWDGTAVTIGWVGDSRAYWVAGGQALRLTVDHSWAELQIAEGALNRDDAEADGRAHSITRWLGAGAPDEQPSVSTFEPAGRGRVVLCTDGLWNHIPDVDELGALLAEQPGDASPVDVSRSLAHTAIERGGHDNVTVAVIEVAAAGGDEVLSQLRCQI
jgi:serine/threonine protein phosphatase PrpC